MTTTDELTVDQLALAAGMTVRTVRAHQNRGLLPPPRIEGRTGYYSRAHLHRLQHISNLQQRGYSLAAIADVVEQAPTDHGREGLAAIAAVSFVEEAPVELSAAELAERAERVGEDATILHRLVEAGLAEAMEDGGVRILSPAVHESGEALVNAGADAESVIALQERLRDATAAMAADIVKVAHQEVLMPGLAAAETPAEVQEVVELMLGLRPLAFRAVGALLQQGFDRALADALGATPEAT